MCSSDLITDLIKKNALKQLTVATFATSATQKPTVAIVATVAKEEDQNSELLDRVDKPPLNLDDDSYCWPKSQAFNNREIAITIERIRFLKNRLGENDADRMADLLIARDREMLDMTYCFECKHLEGFGDGPWLCTNAIRAEVNCTKERSSLPRQWPWMLMRCFGFKSLQ